MPPRTSDFGLRRLHAQLGPFDTVGEAVARLGAVQGQDFLASLWAVGLRVRGATEASVEQALRDRVLVRTWPMRGTLHLVCAEDARWMLELLAPRALARAARRFHELGLDAPTFTRARRVLERALGKGPVTRPGAYAVLDEAGISTAGQRGVHLLFGLAHQRVLCLGPREGKQPTVALFDAQVPPATRRRTRDEALAELATRYVAGHGPATVDDFAWWSGLGAPDAREALHLARSRLESEEEGGETYWFQGRRRARADAVHLLPPFDEFLVAYKARRHVVADPQHVNTGGNGILSAVVVAGGRVVGTWKRTLGAHRVRVVVSWLEEVGDEMRAKVEACGARYARFLGAEAVGVE